MYVLFIIIRYNTIKKLDVSNGNNFGDMFYGCSLLSDISLLQKWNVSNGNNVEGMFSKCSPLLDIT